MTPPMLWRGVLVRGPVKEPVELEKSVVLREGSLVYILTRGLLGWMDSSVAKADIRSVIDWTGSSWECAMTMSRR